MASSIGTPAYGPAALPGAVPARRAATTPADAQAIEAAMSQLRATRSGREIADYLVASRMEIRVLPDADFARRYPGAGAVYDPKAEAISVPQGGLHRSSFVTTLAHEGKHAMDFSERPHWALQSFGLIGGSAKDGLKELVTFGNPVTGWLDSLTARQNEDEVNAYHLQAQVAHELGKNESSWSLGQARDGTPLPIDEVRSNVATNDLYRMDPTRRLILGAGLGLGVTSFAAIGAQTLASKLRPGSFLAGHAWPIYAIGGAMTAAWVVGDQIRARRLEAA
jgi:hypothetical protein